MNKRPLIFVALAGLAAILASVVVYSALKKRDAAVQNALAKTTYIAVAGTDLPLGSKIDASQVRMAKWSADSLPTGAITDTHQVVGSYVKSAFVANEPIVSTKLFLGEKTAGVMPLLIPPGMRAVSVPVDEVSDVAGFVLPHTHVDILVALQNENGKSFSKIVLQNVEVLAIAQEVEGKKDEPQLVKVVTVLVNPQDAERLALACREGTLRLAMRNYTDDKIVLTSGSDVPDMLHSYDRPVTTPVISAGQHILAAPVHPTQKMKIQIFRNGKSSESVSFIRQAAAEPTHFPSGTSAKGRDRANDSIWNVDQEEKPEADAPPSQPAPGPAANTLSAPPAETAAPSQASAPAAAPEIKVSTASFAPRSKVIDLPWPSGR